MRLFLWEIRVGSTSIVIRTALSRKGGWGRNLRVIHLNTRSLFESNGLKIDDGKGFCFLIFFTTFSCYHQFCFDLKVYSFSKQVGRITVTPIIENYMLGNMLLPLITKFWMYYVLLPFMNQCSFLAYHGRYYQKILHAFFISNAFFNSASVLLTFLKNRASNVVKGVA